MQEKKIIIPTPQEIKSFSKKNEETEDTKADDEDVKKHYQLCDPHSTEIILPREELIIIPPETPRSIDIGWFVSESVGVGLYNSSSLKNFNSINEENWADKLREIVRKSKDD